MNREFLVDKVGIQVTGVLWKPGDPISVGRWTAIDTETLLIDDNKPSEYPQVVLMTVYGGGKTVDLVTWEYIDEYLDILFKRQPVCIFHNAPFDMNVLGITKWIPLIDAGKIMDTGIQWILHKMGTTGLSDEADEYPKLARVTQDVLGQELEKDSDVRCTFTREMDLDVVHAVYACGDAVATYAVALAMAPDHQLPPTMDIQIKGFVSLDSISRNGMLVDKEWMRNLRLEYLRQKDDLKLKLEDLGITVEKELETKEIYPYVKQILLPNLPDNPKIDDLRLAITLANRGDQELINAPWPEDKQVRKELLAEWIVEPPFHIPLKHTAKQLVNMLWKAAMNKEGGKIVSDGMQEWWDKHDGWPAGWKQVGTTTQLQRLMADAEQYLSRPLPRTESGMIALDDKALESIPKDDLAKLKFLEAFKDYKHAEKMVSTYLDEKILKADGRVHSRYVPVKATGKNCRCKITELSWEN